MVLLTSNKVEIKKPVQEVYNFVTNMENFGSWCPEVIKIKAHNNLEHGLVGKKYLETVKDPLKGKVDIVLEVKKAETNSLFITEGEYPPLLPKMIVQFSATNNTCTELSWSMESRTKSFITKIFMIPLAKTIMKKRAKVGMENLKRILENGKN